VHDKVDNVDGNAYNLSDSPLVLDLGVLVDRACASSHVLDGAPVLEVAHGLKFKRKSSNSLMDASVGRPPVVSFF
jgi:hypothetical protein